MVPLFHGSEGLLSLLHGEYAVYHWVDSIGCQGLIHGFEMSPGAYIDTVYSNLAMKKQGDGHRLV
jgi:hypothetical protein